MIKKKVIAVTGLNGVVGNIFADLYGDKYDLIDLYHKKKVSSKLAIKKHYKLDLLDGKKIQKVLRKTSPSVIVHLAAITHIDRCEKDRKKGEKGNAWRINVDATREIADFCVQHKIPLIYLSTECVFDGQKKTFNENSRKNPRNWYGITKSAAEDLIIKSGAKFAIIRSVVAYHKKDHGKTIYGKVLSSLRNKGVVFAVSDQLFTPTYTEDIVRGISTVIDKNLRGVFHVAPRKSISPYDFAVLIAQSNNYKIKQVKKATLHSLYGKEKADLRLINASLSATKSRKALEFVPKNPSDVI
ncbi:MAG TPA: SDR family oxidoreductase [Patescibacteria group bacterium]|nr:SDR family oxidoreductase [Patescibacteria group bacterium]